MRGPERSDASAEAARSGAPPDARVLRSQEHLRKAENKLVHNLVPYLELAHKARLPPKSLGSP